MSGLPLRTDADPRPVEILRTLSSEAVCKDAVWSFVALYGKADRPFHNQFTPLRGDCRQLSVDRVLSESDRDAAIEQFHERIIAPAMGALKISVPRNVAFRPLELPSGCQCSRQMWRDVSIRMVTGWRDTPILDDDGEVIGYEDPVPVIRFDVMVTTEAPV